MQLFYQKQIYPNVTAPPTAMRDYYERHKTEEFTVHGRAKFRLIKIDPRDRKFGGSREEALKFAEQIKARAADTDFAKLADEVSGGNNGGLVGTATSDYWVETDGSYRYPALEKAVIALKPTQVTDIIQEEGLFLIAKLEALREGKVLSFEDPAVQEKIAQKLRGQQVEAMREKHVNELEQKSITVRKPGQMAELLENGDAAIPGMVRQRRPGVTGGTVASQCVKSHRHNGVRRRAGCAGRRAGRQNPAGVGVLAHRPA